MQQCSELATLLACLLLIKDHTQKHTDNTHARACMQTHHPPTRYSQSRCFFLGPLTSCVEALHTALLIADPVMLCCAAAIRSVIDCPDIVFHRFATKPTMISWMINTHTMSNDWLLADVRNTRDGKEVSGHGIRSR